jgi:hypothetical protein
MGIRSRACLELSIPCVLLLCDDQHTFYQPTSCAERAISWKAALRGAPRYIMCDACPHRCIFLITARNSNAMLCHSSCISTTIALAQTSSGGVGTCCIALCPVSGLCQNSASSWTANNVATVSICRAFDICACVKNQCFIMCT